MFLYSNLPSSSSSTSTSTFSNELTTHVSSSDITTSTFSSDSTTHTSSSDITTSATPTTHTTSAALASSTAATTTTSGENVGAIAGGVVGGVVFFAFLILGTILFCRARRRKHVAPSSEFVETINRGELPVLRLDSGMEIMPTSLHPAPLHSSHNSYISTSDIRHPDGMIWSDAQSARYSLEKPLQPLRYPVQEVDAAPIGSSSVSQPSSDSPLMQDSHGVAENVYVDLWKLSVARRPDGRSPRPSAASSHGVDVQALIPIRRVVDQV